MPDNDFAKIEQAFNAAVGEREAGRTPAITVLSGGDPKVAAEVRALLAFVGPGESDGSSTPTGSGGPAAPFLDPAELHAGRAENAAVRDSLRDEWDASAAGQRVGEFELIAPIGVGHTGVVFVAEQRMSAKSSPTRRVALKLIRRTVATPAVMRRFEREAELVGRLDHPGIAQIYAAGVAELISVAGPVRVPYLAMELVDGPPLPEHVTRLPANTDGRRRAAIALIAQAAEAVHHAHQRGVIHRDLKPANLLVATGVNGVPQVKVLDFGVARRTTAAVDAFTTTMLQAPVNADGGLVCPIAYLSPEQVKGVDSVDVRTDVYAIGVMLYQLLCYRLPILTDGCPLPEAARRIIDDLPPRPSTFERQISADLDTVVLKAIEKDAARRYASCADLARDLRHVLADEPIDARVDTLVRDLSRRVAAYRLIAWCAALIAAIAAAYALLANRR